MKELIKVKGNQVAPAELEGLLLEHPHIADACVVGVTINGGELPRAYVVVQERGKGKLSEQDVAEWLAHRVSRTKRLDGGVVFVDAVPKNPVRCASVSSLLAGHTSPSTLSLSNLVTYPRRTEKRGSDSVDLCNACCCSC